MGDDFIKFCEADFSTYLLDKVFVASSTVLKSQPKPRVFMLDFDGNYRMHDCGYSKQHVVSHKYCSQYFVSAKVSNEMKP